MDADLGYLIKCEVCGRFIPRKDIEERKAKFKFTPSNQFGPEESYWFCKEHAT